MKARRSSRRHAPGRSGSARDPDEKGAGDDALLHTSGAARLEVDPLTGSTAEVRRIQPYAAGKPYTCPGCNQTIAPGAGHLVVVPLAQPGDRRHWHAACWAHRARRRPGR